MVSWVVVGISDCGVEERSRQTGMSRRSISKQVCSMETELAEQREGGRGRSWIWSSGQLNNASEGHPGILYILVQESYRDTRMRHLRHSVCHTMVIGLVLRHQQNRLGSQEMMKLLCRALLVRYFCFWNVFEESQRNTCSLKSQVLMWCFLNLNCHCLPYSTVVSHIPN